METPTLKRVFRLDSIPLSATYWTNEGYLRDEPIVTSVGIFEYANPDGTIRRELRLPENVFDPASLASYEGKPIIITHDAGEVNKNNVTRETIGTILSPGVQDGEDVRAKIVIHNVDAMKRAGLRELSLGYSLDLDEAPGVWRGQKYDAIQKNIRINHLALVDSARAGEQARLNIDSRDTRKGVKAMSKFRKDSGPLTPEELEQAIAEYKARREGQPGSPAPNGDNGGAPGLPPAAPGAEKQDEGAETAEKIQMVKDRRDRRDAEGYPADQEGTATTIAQMDEDIGTLLEVIEAMEAQKDFDGADDPAGRGDEGEDPEGRGDEDDPTKKPAGGLNADGVDAIIRERVRLARLGDKLHLDGLDTMNIADAKRAIVRAVRPGMRLDGKGASYLNAAFDLAVDEIGQMQKNTNYQRGQMFNADGAKKPQARSGGAADHRKKMIETQDGGKK